MISILLVQSVDDNCWSLWSPATSSRIYWWQKGPRSGLTRSTTKINKKKCKRHCYTAWMKLHYDDFGGPPLGRGQEERGRKKGTNGVTLCRWKLGEVTLEINVPSSLWANCPPPPPLFLPFHLTSPLVNF